MSKYSEYMKLTVRCHSATRSASYKDVERILAEVLRTLQTVTPEMENDVGLQPIAARAVWLAMLHASPLEPSK
jgi:hypothetical protein